MNGTGYLGLVHGDACPDNMRFRADGCRIFDFETSGWGPVVLDAAYLLAPFPSCWCFARLPAQVAAPALDAYRAVVQAAGFELGPDWDAAMAAAVAVWIVARGPLINRVLGSDEDHEWGTTTMRPRLLTWLGSFTDVAGRALACCPDCGPRRARCSSGLARAGRRRPCRTTRRWPGRVRRGSRCRSGGSRACERPTAV